MKIFLLLLIFICFLIEFFVGAWFNSSDDTVFINGNIPRNVQLNLPYYLQKNIIQNHIYSRDGRGLRNTIPSSTKNIVLFFGGSLVDQRRISTEESTPYIVSEYLQHISNGNWAAVNLGIDGHTLLGNLYSLNYWVPLLTNEKLKNGGVVLVLSANDAMFYFSERKILNPNLTIKEAFSKKSGLIRIYFIFTNLLKLNLLKTTYVNHDIIDFKEINYEKIFPSSVAISNSINNANLYRLTLKEFLNTINLEKKSNLLCMNHPDMLSQINGNGFKNAYYSDSDNIEYSSSDILFSYKLLSSVLKEECEKFGGNFLDVANDVRFNNAEKNEYFYNIYHLNLKGQKILNNIIIEEIAKLGIFIE